jgi:hypothetical protein
MRNKLRTVAAITLTSSALIFADWFIQTSIQAGTLIYALMALGSATAGLGLLYAHFRAETLREQARERRYEAAETRARLMEETHTWQRERSPWN